MPFMEFDALTLLTTIFWVWMLIDCLFHKRVKIGWFLFILFTHVVGAVIYYFVACSNRNPVDALAYYLRRLTGVSKPKKTNFAPPKPPKPSPQAPIMYTPYQQGYQSQAKVPEPPVYQEAPPLYDPQPEYEQPTTTYPEMPPQQMH